MTLYFAGIDIGSTMTKVAIMGDSLLASVIGPTGPEHRRLANRVMEEALEQAGLKFDQLSYVVATGYGRINVPFADKQVTEITCHAKGLHSLLPSAKTIVDIGGQDTKGIKIKDGKVVSFVMNDKCAAGTGRFLEVIADALGVPLDRLGEVSLTAKRVVAIANTCTVFAEQEVISQLAGGESVANLVAGVHEAIATRVYSMVNKLKIEPDVAITGGGAKNIGLVKALETKFGCPVLVPPEPLLTGAIGAALVGKEAHRQADLKGVKLERSSQGLREATFFE